MAWWLKGHVVTLCIQSLSPSLCFDTVLMPLKTKDITRAGISWLLLGFTEQYGSWPMETFCMDPLIIE
jgi:hypothetical protein